MPLFARELVFEAEKTTDNETDYYRVNSDSTRECAGMICDVVLLPGQQISIEVETGLEGSLFVDEKVDNFESAKDESDISANYNQQENT